MTRCKRVIDIIVRLDSNGTLGKLYAAGLVSPKAHSYSQMYLKFDACLKIGMSRTAARQKVAAFFDGDERTVSRAIRLMSTPV